MFGWEVGFLRGPARGYHMKPIDHGVAVSSLGTGGEDCSDSDHSNRKMGRGIRDRGAVPMLIAGRIRRIV